MPLNNKEGYCDPPFRTATETIVKIMEKFGEVEPRSVVIIHTDIDGQVVITANTNKTNALGMLMMAQDMILKNEV